MSTDIIAVQGESEVAAILKVPASGGYVLESYIKTHHPYDAPCIVALPIEKGCPRI